MQKRARLATTAGATVLTFVALGGVAQADPLGDATDGLTDTLGGVVNTVTGGVVNLSTPTSTSGSSSTSTSKSKTASRSSSASKAGSSGGDPSLNIGLNGPVHANTRVKANSSPGNGTQASVSVNAGVRGLNGRGDLLRASLNVGVDTCGFAPEECGQTGAPPPVVPPGSGPPPSTPPGVTGPPGAGPAGTGATIPGVAAPAPSTMKESLPFTGGPLGALTGIGVAAVLTGAAAVGASRVRVRRDPH
ncbi:MAG TPA: hypothetical protein VF069_12875 [Streptosporangiaceae bacterium]